MHVPTITTITTKTTVGQPMWRTRPHWAALVVLMLLLAACASGGAVTTAPDAPLPATVPPLPFTDNPDPTLCGIPQPVKLEGIVHSEVDGVLVGPVLYLFESHARQKITGQIFPGTRVAILLSQSNPTLDYYFVKTINVTPAQEGWIPAPFVAVQS